MLHTMKRIPYTIFGFILVVIGFFVSIFSVVRAIDIPVFSLFESTTSSLVAHWDTIPDASYYNVSSTASAEVVKTTNLNTTFTGLGPSTAYTFQIEAVDISAVSSGFSAPTIAYTSPRTPTSSTFSNITTSSIDVSWASLAEAVYYTVSSTAGTVTTTDTDYTFSGLTPNTEYTFQVSVYDQYDQESAFSDAVSTSTENLPLLAPPVVSGFTETTSTIQVYWDAISGASYYLISRATSQTVVAETISVGNGVGADHALPINRFYNYSVSEMLYLNTEVGIAGPISSISFYKQSGSSTPTIGDVSIYLKHTETTALSTGNASTGGYTEVYSGSFPNAVSSGWVGVSTTPFYYNGTDNLSVLVVKGYELFTTDRPYYRYTATPNLRARQYYSDEAGFSSGVTSLTETPNRPNIRLGLPTIELGGTIVTVTTTDTEYVFAGLSPSTTYYFQVYTVDEIGQSSVSSSATSTVTETPPPPIIPEITNLDVATSTAEVSWDLVYGAIYYTVSSTAGTVTTTDLFHTFSGLTPSTTYYFQVQAHDAYMQVSGFSDVTSTVTDITPVPDIPVFTNTSKTTSSISLAWDIVTYAASYTVSSTAGSEVEVTSTAYIFTNLTPPSTTYYFQVKATDQFGRSSDFSEVTSTATDSLLPPAIPVVSTLTPTYSTIYFGWDVVTGAVYYTVSSTAGMVTTTQNYYIFSGLTPSSTYYFQVKSTNAYDQESEYSTVTSTATGNAPSFLVQDTMEITSSSVSTFLYTGASTTYTVPEGVTSIIIDAYGAGGGSGGGNSNAGSGARMRGSVSVTPGEVLSILVGATGGGTDGEANSGGGGSFVVRSPYNTTSSVLVVAGGGGGHGNSVHANRHGQITTSGGSTGGAGGINGSGGSAGTYSGGGGFLSNGGGASGGYSFISGLPGTIFSGCVSNQRVFGGGGGGSGCSSSGGGGGGYSGGGGGSSSSGGGGGSIINGTTLIATAGGGSTPNTNGQIIIAATSTIVVDGGFRSPYVVETVASTTFTYTGSVQTYTVPEGVTSMRIDAYGAQGGSLSSYVGGYGAQMSGFFNINSGSLLHIIVGGKGVTGTTWAGGGGGGSFVYQPSSTLYIAAGGGGGAANGAVGLNATTTSNGVAGTLGGVGGTNGTGGSAGLYSGGGAGWISNGGDTSYGKGGKTSSTAWAGGVGYSGDGAGGFGGGGGAYAGGGGGGGYSGGGAGGYSSNARAGGGGGSYNAGTNQSNSVSSLAGNGEVIIYVSTTISRNPLTATTSTDDSGYVTLVSNVDDLDDDSLMITYRYSAGACGAYSDILTTMTLIGTPSSTYGQGSIVLDNATSTGYQLSNITTASGVNTVTTTWDSKSQLPLVEDSIYCIYAVVSDGVATSTVATTTVTINNLGRPTASSLSLTPQTNGSGHVTVKAVFDDVNDDVLSLTYRYKSGSCTAFNGTEATSTLLGTPSSTYGQGSVVLDNATSTGYQLSNITTASGVNTVTTTWDSKSQLPSGTGTHCVYVVAYDGISTSTVVSASVTLDNVPPTQPSISSYSKTATAITVNWAAVSGASFYTVSSTANATVTTTLTNRTFSSLIPTTTYTFQIMATDSYNNTSTFSIASSTRTDSIYTPVISSFSSITTSSITVNWSAVSGASYYTVSSTAGTVTTTLTSRTFSGLSIFTSYDFQISATDVSGLSSTSSVVTTTRTNAPNAPNAPSVTDLSAATSTIQVSWNAINGASYYILSRANTYILQGTSSSTISIANSPTVTQGLSSPLTRYYTYSASEMLYLNSELTSTSGTIHSIAFYKASPNNVNELTGVTIYMKLTSATTTPTSTVSLTGYTEVYDGAFPNPTGSSVWRGVGLTTPFVYDGISNLQVLVVHNQAGTATNIPHWTHNTLANFRTRTYVSNSTGWSESAEMIPDVDLPHVQFNYWTGPAKLYGEITSVTTTQTNYLLTNLSPSTTYYFQVIAVDEYAQQSASSTVTSTYTLTPPPPVTPTIVSSTNNTSSIQISWDAVYGAIYYTVSSTTGLVVTTTAQTSLTFTGLTPSTTYTFQVKANDAYNQSSTFSSALTTSTILSSIANAPTLSAFTNITSNTIRVNWGTILWNSYYTVSSTAGTITTTATNYTFSGLTPSTTHNFQVKSTDIWGRDTAYSSVGTTSTPKPTAPSTPTIDLFDESTLDTSSTIQVYWDTISGASYYTLYYSTTVTGTSSGVAGYGYVGQGTSAPPLNGANNTPLDRYWNYSSAEMIYLPSELGSRSFTISSLGFYKDSGTSNLSVANVAIYLKHTSETTTPTGNTSLTGYTQVYSGSFANSGTSGWQNVNLSPTFSYNGTSSLQILVTKGYEAYVLTGNPIYRYTSTVPNRARSNANDQNGWGTTTTLTATDERPNISFNRGTTTTLASTAPIYQLTGTITTVTTTQTSTIITGLTPSTTYYFVIKAMDPYAQSSASSTVTSTATPPSPSPSSTTITSFSRATSTLTVTWAAASGAGYYTVSSTAGATVTTTQTSQTFTGLIPNTSYSFQIQPVNSYGVTTTYSPVSSTLTLALPPSITSFAWPTTSSISVSWSTVTGTTYYTVSTTAGTVTTTQTSRTFTGLTPGTTYTFQVASNLTDYSVASSTYILLGTFLSDIKDIGYAATFGTIDWNDTIPTGASITMEVRAGNQSDLSDGVWTFVSKGDALNTNFDGRRYYQYRTILFTSSTDTVPSVEDVTVSYYGPSTGSFISSPFDSGSALNYFAGISWTATTPSSTAFKIQVRTSPDNSDWTAWVGPDGTNGTYFTDGSGEEDIPAALSDGANDRWIQYRAFFEGNGIVTPTLSDISLTYTVNATPDIVISTSTIVQSSNGTVIIPYEVRDLDTSTGATQGVVSVDLQYCTASCGNPGSETWATAASSSLTGDFGANIGVEISSSTTYSSYSLTWTPVLSYDNQYNDTNFKIRLRANDGEAANNTGVYESNVFTLDTIDPVVTSFITDARADAANPISITVTDDTMSGLEMKLSTDSDLSNDGTNLNSGDWIPYTATSSWTFVGSPAKVYYQIRDAYGNVSSDGETILIQTLYAPPNFVYQDVSNAVSADWREFLAWEVIPAPSNGFNNYTLYRSEDGDTYDVLMTEENRLVNYYLDQNLDTEITYYYKMTVEDDEGNISNYSSIVMDTPDGQGGSDVVAPTISNVQTSDVGTQSFTVTWDTDELSNSYIDYIAVPGGDFSDAPSVGSVSLADTEMGIGEHQVILTGLTPNTTYYFQVRSIDPSGNEGVSSSTPDGYTVSTLSGPSITGIGVSDISNTQVSVTWITDEGSDSYVYYSLDNTFTSSTVVGNADSVTEHSVTLPNLTRGTTYYYYVKSGVGEDKNVVDGEIMYHTFTTLNDQAPPIITFDEETDIEISDTAMIVTWSTNEPATTVLEYGTSTSYGTVISNDDLNTSHNYTISGLTLDTLYYVRFTNTDLNDNASNPTEFSTTTADSTDYTPPVITVVTTTVVTDDQALITWVTDEGSTSQVYYGTSSSTLDLFSTTNSNYDRTHAVILSSLATSTEYFYYVMSIDLSGNVATSTPIQSFATLETLSEESEVLLREQAAAAAVPTTSGGGGGGGGSTRDSTPPEISNAEVAEVTGLAAKLTWSTNEIADSVVEFGNTTSYGKAGVNLERTFDHEIVLNDLLPLTDYYYRISSADTSGNRSAFTTGSFTTTLSDAPISTTSTTEDIVDSDAAEEMFMMSMQRVRELIKNLSTQVSVEVLESTLLDQTSVIQELSELLPRPVIGGQPVVDESANTATISWTTDKASNSLIEFVSEGVFTETGAYSQTVGQSAVYTTDHTVEIQGLNPSTPYRYRLISRTPTGAESTSRDFSFTTKAQSIEIGSYKIAVISPEEAVFTWSTSLPTDSSISYTPYRNGVPSIEARQVVRDPSIVSEHSVTVSGLEGGVVYDIELIGRDTAGNTASKLIQGFSTDDTDAPPVISQIKTDSSIIPGAKDRIQVIISWVTNELSTSQVFYRSGFGTEGAEFSESTTLDSNYTKKHIVVVTNFEPGSVYQFVVESKDSSGNAGRSKTLTVLTPQKEESVFQVIMGNFEDLFGWVGKLRK